MKSWGICMLLVAATSVTGGVAQAQNDWMELTYPEDYQFRFELRVWFVEDQELSGTLTDTYLAPPVFGAPLIPYQTAVTTTIDLGSDTRFSPYAEWQFAEGHKARASFYQIDEDAYVPGNQFTVVANGVYVPQALLANSHLRGSLEANIIELGYEWDFWRTEHGHLGALIDLAIVDYDVDGTAVYADASGFGIRIYPNRGENGTVPIPQIGLAGRVYVHERVALFGELKGMNIGDGALYQLFGGPEFQVNDNFAINGGYRYFKLEVDEGDFDVEYEEHGFFLSTVFRF